MIPPTEFEIAQKEWEICKLRKELSKFTGNCSHPIECRIPEIDNNGGQIMECELCGEDISYLLPEYIKR